MHLSEGLSYLESRSDEANLDCDRSHIRKHHAASMTVVVYGTRHVPYCTTNTDSTSSGKLATYRWFANKFRACSSSGVVTACSTTSATASTTPTSRPISIVNALDLITRAICRLLPVAPCFLGLGKAADQGYGQKEKHNRNTFHRLTSIAFSAWTTCSRSLR